MSSVTINWVESTPASGDPISSGPAVLQSLQSSLRIGLAAEHDWPSSTGPAGGHKLGSARAFVGATSKISSADTTGRVMFDSTLGDFWYVGSDSTTLIGGQNHLKAVQNLAGTRQHVAMSMFTTSVSTNAGRISFPLVSFVNPPMVVASSDNTVSWGHNTPGVFITGIDTSGCSYFLVDALNPNNVLYNGSGFAYNVTISVLAAGVVAN